MDLRDNYLLDSLYMSLAEVLVTICEAMEKLEAAETGYNVVSSKFSPSPEKSKDDFPSSFFI